MLALVLAAACVAGRTTANPYADPERDCQSFETLTAPSRQGTPFMSPPLWRVRACPERAGTILAGVLLASRSLTDPNDLDRRTFLAQYVHDARLLDAGITVAADTSATPEVRMAAFRVLLWSKAPGHNVPLARMSEGTSCMPLACVSSYTGHFYHGGPFAGDTTSWPVFGVPMPAGYVARIDSVASLVEQAQSSPETLRRVALLVRRWPPDEQLKGR